MNIATKTARLGHRKSAISRATGLVIVPMLAAFTLAGCDGATNAPPPVVVAPAPTPGPTPTPPPTAANFNVTRCLNQTIPGTGLTVAGAVVPDTLTINLAAASGFPNGRRLPDPVIDVILGVIFLDLTVHSPALLAGVPVNPPANDLPFRSVFPYLAAPQGAPPLADTSGTTFNFRTDPPTAYARVDRMGFPAVATALISSSAKVPYNVANPSDDAAGTFVPEITRQLTGLTNALADDLGRLGLTPCATPA